MSKVCAKCQVNKPLVDFSKDSRAKDLLQAKCKECDKEYRVKNKSEIKKYQDIYYKNNKDKLALSARIYYQKNKNHCRLRHKKWTLKNTARSSKIKAKYRAAKINSAPNWLSENDYKWIEWIYVQRQRLTEFTGIMHHVDHIHPLQGKNICGLHVPWNLQILTATENLNKSNKYKRGE